LISPMWPLQMISQQCPKWTFGCDKLTGHAVLLWPVPWWSSLVATTRFYHRHSACGTNPLCLLFLKHGKQKVPTVGENAKNVISLEQ
jgi:hypothetical protein